MGEANYLRALVCINNLGRNQNHNEKLSASPSVLWLERTSPLRRKRARDDREVKGDDGKGPHHTKATQSQPPRSSTQSPSGRSSRRCHGRSRKSGLVAALGTRLCVPEIDYDDIKFLHPIGYGRRGTMFAAKWKNETVAVKQFDTWKNDGFNACKREIAAYAHLKEAWGRLVPSPRLLSEAHGVIFLGMQMAEHPPDTAQENEWDEVIDELCRVYSFRHGDLEGDPRSCPHNRMVIRGPVGTQPVFVDLEDYELHAPSTK